MPRQSPKSEKKPKKLASKTLFPKKEEIKRDWHLFDASGKILGRLATEIALKLMGKHKTDFTYHLDCGDYVVVINAKKIRVTGRKLKQKVYQHYSGYPGGLKEVSLGHLMEKKPERVIYYAVWGMLPKNKLRKQRMARLRIVADSENPYQDKFSSKKEKKDAKTE